MPPAAGSAGPDADQGQFLGKGVSTTIKCRQIAKLLTQKDPIVGAMAMVGTARAIQADMEDVVQLNGCASAGLERFEENLRQFALIKQPIRLGYQGRRLSAISPPTGVPFRDLIDNRLIEDLVAEHSKSWAKNRYLLGGVRGVSVTSRIGQGRPAKIAAQHTYDEFNGRSQSSVKVTFADSQPGCVSCLDFAATCRTPNRAIVAFYSDGAYQGRVHVPRSVQPLSRPKASCVRTYSFFGPVMGSLRRTGASRTKCPSWR